jgi:GAF domain-containing protein
VSLVDDRRQFFKSAVGLHESWASRRETPLTHSFCKFAVGRRAPLVVPDAREDPALRENLAIRDLGVIAYAGVPLVVEDEALGAFCVIDDKPHAWTACANAAGSRRTTCSSARGAACSGAPRCR